ALARAASPRRDGPPRPGRACSRFGPVRAEAPRRRSVVVCRTHEAFVAILSLRMEGRNAMSEAAIGVFDSGVGGLSVLREIRAQLPAEDLLYVADSGAAPYGERTEEFIRGRVRAIVEFFLRRQVKAIVVACNTATAVAVELIRSQYDIPVVAVEPAVKPAAALTKSGVIGVLATSRTLSSERFARLAGNYGEGVTVLLQACPGFVEQVEKGELDSVETRGLVQRYVGPLIDQGVDTLVLGCTHYPFLRAAI